jgi:hypothetical protein
MHKIRNGRNIILDESFRNEIINSLDKGEDTVVVNNKIFHIIKDYRTPKFRETIISVKPSYKD